MQSVRERYYNDSQFRNLVDMMLSQIVQCHYSPSEMREAAVLACILYNQQYYTEIPKVVYDWLDGKEIK